MMEAPAVTGQDRDAFEALDRDLRTAGADAVLDQLIAHLGETGQYRAQLDAMLLNARRDLGLPLIQVGSLSDLPEPARTRYEERYVEAIRTVGRRILASGDIAAAWPYFRVIGEPELVRDALTAYRPEGSDETLGILIDIALTHGANPERGFELVLEHYGTCSAISAFEQLPNDPQVRAACAGRLIRQLHSHLAANLRAEIQQLEGSAPPENASIATLLAGRERLFDDDAYHIDVSHLAATVRVSPLVSDPDILALALDLTEYGCRLSDRHRYDAEPPFEDTYNDHGAFLRALLGLKTDGAIAHFRAKLETEGLDRGSEVAIAQVLTDLLVRLERFDEAIDVVAEYLRGIPESSLGCPGLAQICQRAGRLDRLAESARATGDIVNYAAAMLQTRTG